MAKVKTEQKSSLLSKRLKNNFDYLQKHTNKQSKNVNKIERVKVFEFGILSKRLF